MGLSHLAVLTAYIDKKSILVAEQKLGLRLFFRLLGFRVYKSIEVALNKSEFVTASIISTPTSSHYELALYLLQKKVPVLVEKPLTLNSKNSSKLVKLAQKTGINGRVGFVLRYVDTFKNLRRLIKSGELGSVQSYNASMLGNVIKKELDANNWLGDASRGGGCLNEYGPHLLDLIQFVFGEIESIDFVESTSKFSKRADDRNLLKCTHVSGTKGELFLDWCDSTKRKSTVEMTVNFENATVQVDNSGLTIFKKEKACEAFDSGDLGFPSSVQFYLRGEEFSLEIEDFLKTVAGYDIPSSLDVDEPIYATFEDGYQVDCLIEKIRDWSKN